MKTQANTDRKAEYFILSVSRKRIFLVKVTDNHPVEIKDDNFPMVYEETYEYSRSVIGTSFGYSSKGFEKDKSVMKETRFISFLRAADKHLGAYLSAKPFVLAGVERDRADFKHLTKYSGKLIGEVKGSYTAYNLQQLLQSSRDVFEARRNFGKNN